MRRIIPMPGFRVDVCITEEDPVTSPIAVDLVSDNQRLRLRMSVEEAKQVAQHLLEAAELA